MAKSTLGGMKPGTSRLISRGLVIGGAGSRSISAPHGSSFKSAAIGQKSRSIEVAAGAGVSSSSHALAVAPAAATPEIAPGIPSLAAQLKSIYTAAASTDADFKNGYAKVLAMDVTAIEKAKVADNKGKLKAKREAVAYVKGALQDCISRQENGLELVRAFETGITARIIEAEQVAAKNVELQALLSERDQRIAELEADKEEVTEGFQGQQNVVLEMEDAYNQSQSRIRELEEAVASLDNANQTVEDAKLLAEGQVEELQAEISALRGKDKERGADATRLHTEREKLSVEITSFQSRTRQLERELEKASDERDRTRTILDQTKGDLAETRERLRNTAKSAEDTLSRSSEFVDKNAQLLTSINCMLADKAALNQELDDTKRAFRQLRDTETELNRAFACERTSHASTMAALEGIRAELRTAAELAAKVPALQESVALYSGRLLEAEAKLVTANESETSWKVSAAAWAASKELLSTQLTDMTEKAAALDAELSSLKSSLGATQDTLAARMAVQAREAEELRSKTRTQGELKKALASAEAALRGAKDDLFASEMERRRLHNMIQELKGNIRVYVRVRPFLPSDADPASARALADEGDEEGMEFAGDTTPAITVAPDGTALEIVAPPSRGAKEGVFGAKRDSKPLKYSFDHVFGQRCGQEDVFNEVSHLVQSALDGYNVCLFSYGQTGSGKTHTMQGGHGAEAGLIPRSVKKILDTASYMGRQGWAYTVEASFLEIYNESVRDLLRESKKGAVAGAGASSDASLTVHQDAAGNTDVPGLSRVPITEASMVDSLLAIAARRRAVACTSMNAQSSRSHSVFTLYVKGEHVGKGIVVTGALNLVDLAGSERLARSGAEGDRKKETAAINKSLSCLADVFTALAKKAPHVPFRNSKLTHLLQPCFRGDGKTLMLVNLSPTMASAFESGCAVKFASQVSQVELGKPKKRVVDTIEDAPAPAALGRAGAGRPPGRPGAHAHVPPPTLPGSVSAGDTSVAASELDSSRLEGVDGLDASYAYATGPEVEDGEVEGEDALEDEIDMHTLGMGGYHHGSGSGSSIAEPFAGMGGGGAGVVKKALAPLPVSVGPPSARHGPSGAGAGIKRPAAAISSAQPAKVGQSAAAAAGAAAKKPRFGGHH